MEQQASQLKSSIEDAAAVVGEILRSMVNGILDYPAHVSATITGPVSIVFTILAQEDEIGKLIGKQGRTARAIRTVLGAAGMKLGVFCQIDIPEDK